MLPCASCHARATTAVALSHDACARCHAAAFAAPRPTPPAKPLCAGCHEPRPARELVVRFSHRVHLDRALMEDCAGFHVGCEDCHGAAGDGRAAATHEACARCHSTADLPQSLQAGTRWGEQGGLSRVPRMDDCAGCHTTSVRPRGRAGSVAFSHAKHEHDRVGRTIPCSACHGQVSIAATLDQVPGPGISPCTLCHEDPRQVPAEARMSHCTLCHRDAEASSDERGPGDQRLRALAPRSHQLGSLSPDDHTLTFRRDHAVAARAPDSRCGACHIGLPQSPRDSCQACHATLRPRDHTVTFREVDHGREAAASRRRCATCHAADYCEACHQTPPRTHFPSAEWAIGHGRVARLELRSCYACHTFEGSGGGAAACAGCHARGLR
jgi:hypothetical protein